MITFLCQSLTRTSIILGFLCIELRCKSLQRATVKSNESLASHDAGRFRTRHWSGVLHSAQSQAPGSRTAYANLCWPYSDPQAVDREIHALCELFIASVGR